MASDKGSGRKKQERNELPKDPDEQDKSAGKDERERWRKEQEEAEENGSTSS